MNALQLAKEVKWPLYQDLAGAPSTEMVISICEILLAQLY